jgi:hypothetical protein
MFRTGNEQVKKRLILVTAVIFSALASAFPSGFESRAERFVSFSAAGKCAIPTRPEAYRQAAAVFVGQVLEEEKKGDVRSFKFSVERYWKGPGRNQMKIDVYENTRYQARFRTGEKYLIYAEAGGKKDSLNVVRCSRSREVGGAADDLKQLGKGKRPR